MKARPATPLPGDRLLLDRLASAAWPALEQVELDGWLLRTARTSTGDAVTKRANSALPLRTDATPDTLDTQLAAIITFYTERGLPPLVQVSSPPLAAALEQRGWAALSPTLVLTGLLPAAAPAPAVPPAHVSPRPDQAWLDCWWAVDGRGGDAGLEVARRCLAALDVPTGYAAVHRDGQVVAVGRGVAQQGWLGIFAMAVLPAYRRRGLGRQVLGALAAWGAEHGTRRSYLLVAQENTVARGLYAQAGLSEAYAYHYRRCP